MHTNPDPQVPGRTSVGNRPVSELLDEHSERRRRKRLADLLARRERLAQAAVEHVSHQLPGAASLWTALDDVEETIREADRATWARLYPEWAARDTERLHMPEDPQPESCRLCSAPDRSRPRPKPRRPLAA